MKKYYTLKNILSKDADYNIIIGERSNGKTYAALKYCIEQYYKSGKQFAYIRRWKDDIIGKRAENVFTAIIQNNEIAKITDNNFTNIIYKSGKYFLANYDNDHKKFVSDVKPICYNFALSDMEHDKSASYPEIFNIIFDEFITRKYYLKDEFILFMNVLSTIIRDRQIDRIFMLGNTVNKYNPYFLEFGIKNTIQQGTIDIYESKDNGARIAVEYCDTLQKQKTSNKYFSFQNDKLNMITRGKWEFDIYPHLPAGTKLKENQTVFSFYVIFDNHIIRGNVIETGNESFIYFHNHTTSIKDNEIIFTMKDNIKPNYFRNIIDTNNKICARITKYFKLNKVFYQSNEIGESIKNYILNTQKINIGGV